MLTVNVMAKFRQKHVWKWWECLLCTDIRLCVEHPLTLRQTLKQQEVPSQGRQLKPQSSMWFKSNENLSASDFKNLIPQVWSLSSTNTVTTTVNSSCWFTLTTNFGLQVQNKASTPSYTALVFLTLKFFNSIWNVWLGYYTETCVSCIVTMSV